MRELKWCVMRDACCGEALRDVTLRDKNGTSWGI